ncbi:hypothetical protein BVC93_31730 (plasmid) [Mycobacterium sp. MS1601]|nr:hypothetical protein BVC93_31730 [Mycobacterium sp. MS1601]
MSAGGICARTAPLPPARASALFCNEAMAPIGVFSTGARASSRLTYWLVVLSMSSRPAVTLVADSSTTGTREGSISANAALISD